MELSLSDLDAIPYVDEAGRQVLGPKWERAEQLDAVHFLQPHHRILEVGGCYGVTSCVINHLLADPSKHLVIEPREKMIQVMHKNRESHKARFHTFHGAISRTPLKIVDASCFSCSEVESNVKTKSVEELEAQYDIDFNALVIDCEGCILHLFRENSALLSKLEIILMEEDRGDICNYKEVYEILDTFNFLRVKQGFHSVWKKQKHE